MTILITGSSGHLGEALMRRFRADGRPARGVDIKRSPFTDHVGSIADRDFVRRCMTGVDAVIHAATLHKPHVATHSNQDFVETNITGTLVLLEAALAVGVRAFIYTSTTSAFGAALVPAPGEPAAWITEDVAPVPKISMASPRSPRRTCASFSHVRRNWPSLCCARPGSFPKQTIIRRSARVMRSRMRTPTSFCIAGSISKML